MKYFGQLNKHTQAHTTDVCQNFISQNTTNHSYITYITACTIVCTYSIYKEAPEDGPLRSETCIADT